MIGGRSAGTRALWSAAGSLLAVLAIAAGERPGPLLASLHGSSVSAVFVFAAFAVCATWASKSLTAATLRWAAGIGAVLATAQLVGLFLRTDGTLTGPLATRSYPVWVVVHWAGTAWMAACVLAAVLRALDLHGSRAAAPGAGSTNRSPGVLARLHRAAGSTDRGRRRRAWSALLAVLVVSRVPYLCVYWPGILAFDTTRSYSYVRGTYPWETYEPVGASLLVGAFQGLGTRLGWGDVGGLAIASVSLVLASSLAFAFMLTRMAAWGTPRAVWLAALAYVALLPVFGYFSITLVKDEPFSIAMVFFLTCLGELAIGDPRNARRWWPWVGLTLAGAVAMTTRNNGVHVMALSLPVLALVLRHLWRRLLVVLAVLAAVFAAYVGPLYSALDVHPGPAEESYSVPLQQLGRISRDDAGSLSAADRAYVVRTFAGMSPEELGKHYVPGLADPMKLQARLAWSSHTTAEFLGGWVRVALDHPLTAVTATLAGTQGYWDPEAAPYDSMIRWSTTDNDRRGVHLHIPGGPQTTGVAGAIERSGIMPTRTYEGGVQDDGYRSIPVLGQAMSPASVCWLWVVGAVLLVRRRARGALAVAVPIGASLLTFLAGPVSGGQRYTLTLFMTLPILAAAVLVASRPTPAAAQAEAGRPIDGSTEVPEVREPAEPSAGPEQPPVAEEVRDHAHAHRAHLRGGREQVS